MTARGNPADPRLAGFLKAAPRQKEVSLGATTGYRVEAKIGVACDGGSASGNSANYCFIGNKGVEPLSNQPPIE